jgi:hypothetical protein
MIGVNQNIGLVCVTNGTRKNERRSRDNFANERKAGIRVYHRHGSTNNNTICRKIVQIYFDSQYHLWLILISYVSYSYQPREEFGEIIHHFRGFYSDSCEAR